MIIENSFLKREDIDVAINELYIYIRFILTSIPMLAVVFAFYFSFSNTSLKKS